VNNIWSAIEIRPSDDSTCASCGMPGHALRTVENWNLIVPAKGFKIPDVPWCCSISCLECVVFGPGRCRSCGTKLGKFVETYGKTEQEYRGGTRYCLKCSASEVPFGNGERLKTYLRRNHPGLLKLESTEKRCALGKKCFKYEGRKPGLVVGAGKYCSKMCADGFRAIAQRGKSPCFRNSSFLGPHKQRR
jgi:hypothetical protein